MPDEFFKEGEFGVVEIDRYAVLAAAATGDLLSHSILSRVSVLLQAHTEDNTTGPSYQEEKNKKMIRFRRNVARNLL